MIDLVPIDSDIGQRSGYGPPEAGRNVDHFALTLSEFDEDAIVAYLEENGVTVRRSGPRFGTQGYGPSVYFQDPDENFVELKGPSEEAP